MRSLSISPLLVGTVLGGVGLATPLSAALITETLTAQFEESRGFPARAVDGDFALPFGSNTSVSLRGIAGLGASEWLLQSLDFTFENKLAKPGAWSLAVDPGGVKPRSFGFPRPNASFSVTAGFEGEVGLQHGGASVSRQVDFLFDLDGNNTPLQPPYELGQTLSARDEITSPFPLALDLPGQLLDLRAAPSLELQNSLTFETIQLDVEIIDPSGAVYDSAELSFGSDGAVLDTVLPTSGDWSIAVSNIETSFLKIINLVFGLKVELEVGSLTIDKNFPLIPFIETDRTGSLPGTFYDLVQGTLFPPGPFSLVNGRETLIFPVAVGNGGPDPAEAPAAATLWLFLTGLATLAWVAVPGRPTRTPTAG